MSNAIPLNMTTDAAGGYLVPDQVGEILIDGINTESCIAQLARKVRLTGRRDIFAIDSGDPVVDFVDESGDKPVTGAAFANLTLNTRKLAAIVIYTEEILEDARADPRVLVNDRLIKKFALKIDAHALGYENGTAIVSKFDSELGESSNTTTDLGTGGDAFALAVSQAMELVEINGYDPSGICAARDVKAALRDARRAVETATPVYTDGFTKEPDTLYGLPLSYTKNLDAYAASSGKKAAVVGDWSNAILGIRTDLHMRVSTDASVNIGGTPRSMFSKNEVAVLWEMRVGFVAHDLNRAFSVIPNAS